jgi:hypothetical protein
MTVLVIKKGQDIEAGNYVKKCNILFLLMDVVQRGAAETCTLVINDS